MDYGYGLESKQHQDPNRTMRLQRVQIIKVETFMCLRSTQYVKKGKESHAGRQQRDEKSEKWCPQE